jgi:hypothetical protein
VWGWAKHGQLSSRAGENTEAFRDRLTDRSLLASRIEKTTPALLI